MRVGVLKGKYAKRDATALFIQLTGKDINLKLRLILEDLVQQMSQKLFSVTEVPTLLFSLFKLLEETFPQLLSKAIEKFNSTTTPASSDLWSPALLSRLELAIRLGKKIPQPQKRIQFI